MIITITIEGVMETTEFYIWYHRMIIISSQL